VTREKGLFQRLLLAAILGTGFTAAWVVVAAFALEISLYVADDEPTRETLLIRRDGTPVVAVSGRGNRIRRDGTPVVAVSGRGDVSYRDLDGNAVEADEDAGVRFGGQSVVLPAHPPRPNDPGAWSARIASYSDGRTPATYWYFVADGREDGAAYFVAYDSRSKAVVGYLGTAGFRPGPLPEAERFPFSCPPQPPGQTRHPSGYAEPHRAAPGFVSAWDVYLPGRDLNLYHIDLQHRSVEATLAGTPVCSTALLLSPDEETRGQSFRPVVRTDDAILTLDAGGRVRNRYPIPESFRPWNLTFYETPSGEAVMYTNSVPDDVFGQVSYWIARVTPAGVTRREQVTLADQPTLWSLQSLGGAVLPVPAALAGVVGVGRSQQILNHNLEATRPAAVARALAEFWPALAIAQLAAAALALLCYGRQVRYGASRSERVVWPLFVLLFGLSGWVGYRFGRSWPTLDRCHSCGVAVPRDRLECARCADEFPRPALKGTEVFA
jgi:hypothetical protein